MVAWVPEKETNGTASTERASGTGNRGKQANKHPSSGNERSFGAQGGREVLQTGAGVAKGNLQMCKLGWAEDDARA